MLFALLSTAALASITVAAPASSPPDEFGNVPNPATYPRPTYIVRPLSHPIATSYLTPDCVDSIERQLAQ